MIEALTPVQMAASLRARAEYFRTAEGGWRDDTASLLDEAANLINYMRQRKPDEYGWLIEYNEPGRSPQWMVIGDGVGGGNEFDFTADASQALRFSRQGDAINFLKHRKGWFPNGLKVTAHSWID